MPFKRISSITETFGKTTKLLVALSAATLAFSCADKASINGRVKNADKELLELSLNIAPVRTLDTCRLKSEGKFAFKYEFKNDYPVFLLLNVLKQNERVPLATLLLEKGENVVIESDYAQPGAYTVKGSKGSELVKELNEKMLTVTASYDSLSRILKQTAENDSLRTRINKETGSLFIKYKQWLIRFIINNSKSYAAYMAMYQRMPNGFALFGKEQDAIYYRTLADSLETLYPKSPYIKQLRDDYKQLINAKAIQEMIENAQEVNGIPDVKLPDSEGREIALSSLRGKVVLLSFWSPEDKGLLMDNMELLETYGKYSSKGFEIYQISLDQSRDRWLQAVHNQQLPWISVSDMKGVNSPVVGLYNLTKLPANFLIDKNGELIARDIFGKTLEQNIEQALK
ncbi:MAG: TlpA family protein disulfide reductase [Prevotellaceae bacterium]|jgi:peroxiredoxin|nr:TlpA family protein disulfide reductase [Prevotellaceae bacterium]